MGEEKVKRLMNTNNNYNGIDRYLEWLHHRLNKNQEKSSEKNTKYKTKLNAQKI